MITKKEIISPKAITTRARKLISEIRKIPLMRLTPKTSEKAIESTLYSHLTKLQGFIGQVDIKPNIDMEITGKLFGLKHRPDAIYKDIALEIKLVKCTSNLQSALGQAICYRSKYPGVVLFLIDKTPGSKLKKSLQDKKTQKSLKWLEKDLKIFIEVK